MAEHYPNEPAFLFESNNGLEITYADLKRRAYLLAENFLKLGLKKGDRIGFILPNTFELLISYFAVSLIGLINVPMDPVTATHEEYITMIEKTKPIVLILFDGEDYKDMIASLLPELRDSRLTEFKSSKFSSIKHVFVVKKNGQMLTGDFNMKVVSWFEEISDKSLNDEQSVEFPLVESDDLFGIWFTVYRKHT